MGTQCSVVPELRYDRICPGRPFHAASYRSEWGSPVSHPIHGQDFAEFMLVTRGGGLHHVNGFAVPLLPGEVILVSPGHVHGVEVKAGEGLHFFNIAFPWECWRSFCRLAGRLEFLNEGPPSAPQVLALGPQAAPQLESLGQTMVAAYLEGRGGLDICRFWCTVLGFWSREDAEFTGPRGAPDWLVRGLAAMEGEQNLRRGVPRLVELCHVSPAHLSRTVKVVFGLSPTEWVNGARLRRIAALLVSTSQSPAVLACQLGFENPSYFHRIFKSRYGMSPGKYREWARSSHVPGLRPL